MWPLEALCDVILSHWWFIGCENSQNFENRTSVPSWVIGTLPSCYPFMECGMCHLNNITHPQWMLIKCIHLQKCDQGTRVHLDATATRCRKFDKWPSWPPEQLRAYLQQDPSLTVRTAEQAGCCGHRPDLALRIPHPNTFSTEQHGQTSSAPLQICLSINSA